MYGTDFWTMLRRAFFGLEDRGDELDTVRGVLI